MNSMSPPDAIQYLFVGVFATAMLDLWAMALNRAIGAPVTNWAHVGRWVAGVRSGTLCHTNIAAVSPAPHERLLGWSTHYIVGVIYAVLYFGVLAAAGEPPGISSATLFGIVTVLAPWLILQPGLGIGYFAANAPKPNRTRALNLLSHLVFGIGLYVGATVAMLDY